MNIYPGDHCPSVGSQVPAGSDTALLPLIHDFRPVTTGMGRVELYCRWCGGFYTP